MVLIVGLSCMTIAFVCALCACAKQRWDFESEQNALASALNNKARQKDCAKSVASLTADELIAQKNEEIASLNETITEYENAIEREFQQKQSEIKYYNETGIALSWLISYTTERGEMCKRACNEFLKKNSNIEETFNSMMNNINFLVSDVIKKENEVIDKLPNYYPQIGDEIDCGRMEEVGEKNFGDVTQIIESGKRCGFFVVRKAKVKTERRIQE